MSSGALPEKSSRSASFATPVPAATGSQGNKSASLTVINELPEAEAVESNASKGQYSAATDRKTAAKVEQVEEEEQEEEEEEEEEEQETPVKAVPTIGPPTLLAPADMLRLQRKHEQALRRANEKAKKRRRQRQFKNESEEGGESADDHCPHGNHRRRRLPKVSTCKSALVALYYSMTLLSALSAALLLFIGLQYRVKSALIAGTLLAFTAFGLCTNHCVSQSLGAAKQRTPAERAAAEEERRILAAAMASAERSLSVAASAVGSETAAAAAGNFRKKSTTPVQGAGTSTAASTTGAAATAEATARVAMATAVDCLLSRRLSTLGICPDPAARLMMMRQQQLHHRNELHTRRRSSMLHLARSMSLVPHEHGAWMAHPAAAGLDDYAEFV